jgi:uncharacterized peroxidase-related enzyme
MPRINPTTQPDAKSQTMLDGIKQSMGGHVPNIFATMAHSPAVLGFYLAGSGALKDASLSATLREQLAVTIAGVNQCDYCASAHTAIGKFHKVADAELTHNLSGQSTDPKTQAALTFVKTLVNTRGKVSNTDLDTVRKAGYTDAQILEMVAVTAFNIFTNYFNHVADTAVDFPLVSTKQVPTTATTT